jgi:hypothetical protein
MPTEDEMTLDGRRKYLQRMKPRYLKAKRGKRSGLLSEMEQGLAAPSLLGNIFI